MNDVGTGLGNDLDDSPALVLTRTAPLALPSDPRLMLQVAQFVLLSLCLLYYARAIVLPILLGVLLKMLLQPGMRALERLYLPRSLAASLLMVGLFGSIAAVVTALTGPAQSWMQKLPEALPRLQERLSLLSRPIEGIRHFLSSTEAYAHQLASPGGATVASAAPGGLSETLFSGTASFASGFFTTAVLVFFLLVSGDTFLRRLVEILPRFGDKRRAVAISQQIESDIAAYLLTITVMNAAVGLSTALVMWACGLGNPLLWGALAFLLNYVPLLGPIVCLTILMFAGLLTLEPLWLAFVPAGAFLLIHAIEGQFVTPILVARRFTLNPVMVVVSVVFWYWMWGVAGAIIAVPMLAMVKIICDGIPAWAVIGHLIGGASEPAKPSRHAS